MDMIRDALKRLKLEKNYEKSSFLSILYCFRSQARVRMAERGGIVNSSCWPETLC